jgi:hypothetical protein
MSAGATDHASLVEETPTTYYEEVVRIPGMEEPPDRCRSLTPVGFCEEGHTVLGRSSCSTRYCPDHWRDWCENAVVAAIARLAAYREAVEGAEKRLSHVVASPPQDRRYGVRQFWDTRGDAYEALEAAGVQGGVMVAHPYRTNERGDRLYEVADDAGELEEGTGKWRFLRDATEDWDDLTEYIEASPHYHALAAAPDIDGGRAPEGWVVERMRTLKRFHRHDEAAYRDMARVAYYVLTHGGVQSGRQLVTYFGAVGSSAFSPEEELTAAAWSKIQQMAEAVVKGEDADHGPEECPHQGCVALVRELAFLEEFLQEKGEDLRLSRGGRERWLRLWGVLMWKRGLTDRPPPSARKYPDRMREWLEERGKVVTPNRSQVGLGGALEA